ncbi:MAG: oligosaccharide flippase family protein [Verrucomicrobia bacterium]|nr:oligosaccharide flippase family protein [Verrucomicrobiota bacterium]
MKQSQRIVKNALFGAAAAAVGGAIHLATILLIAKKVPVAQFGKYSWVLAFAMFFQFLADSGLSRILVREVATQKEQQARIVGAAVALIWILSISIGLVILALLPFLPFGFEVKVAAGLMGLSALSQFHASGYGAVLRAHEDNELTQMGYVLHKVVLFGVVFVSLHRSNVLVGIAVAHVAAVWALWAFYYFIVTRFYLRVHLVADRELWKKLLVTALPMGGGVMLRQLALQADVLVLKSLADFNAVGLFSGPYRIGMALRQLPETLALPLFPLYSRLALESREKLGEVYRQSMKYFSLLSFPFGVFLVAWSDAVIRYAMDPKYSAAVPAMQLLGAGMVPFFASTLFPYLFAAVDEQRRFLVSTAICGALRLALDAALIPPFGFLGPCIAFLVTEFLLVGVWIVQLSRLGLRFSLADALWRPAVASVAMAALVFAVKPLSLPWQLAGGVASVVVYLGVLWLVGTFARDEIATAREGIAFVRPLLAHWSNTLRKKT